MTKYEKDIDISSQFNSWITQSIKDLEKMKDKAIEQERREREAEQRHQREMERIREQERRERARREREAEERRKREREEQARKQREAEERIRKEMEKRNKPKIEVEYRRKVTEKRIWTTHYKKWFMWDEWISGTDYYYETRTECEQRNKIIQNNTISYSKWTSDWSHSKTEKSKEYYQDSELWNCEYSPKYYKGLYGTKRFQKVNITIYETHFIKND